MDSVTSSDISGTSTRQKITKNGQGNSWTTSTISMNLSMHPRDTIRVSGKIWFCYSDASPLKHVIKTILHMEVKIKGEAAMDKQFLLLLFGYGFDIRTSV